MVSKQTGKGKTGDEKDEFVLPWKWDEWVCAKGKYFTNSIDTLGVQMPFTEWLGVYYKHTSKSTRYGPVPFSDITTTSWQQQNCKRISTSPGWHPELLARTADRIAGKTLDLGRFPYWLHMCHGTTLWPLTSLCLHHLCMQSCDVIFCIL